MAVQMFHHYEKWEDFKAGMWRKLPAFEEAKALKIAIEFTGDHILYGFAMLRVLDEWPVTCEHHLSNPLINKRAFIGHCAAQLEMNIPEYITRSAWAFLTSEQQNLANQKALEVIQIWEKKYA